MSRWLVVLAVLALLGCGKTGPLRPPEPHGPLSPGGVAARQIGSSVEVGFTAPEPRGKAPSQRVFRAEILRVSYPPGVVPPVDPEDFRVRGEVVVEVSAQGLTPGRRLLISDPSLVALGGGGIGWTLRYGVRVRDERGRPSPLVVAPDLLTAAPAPAPADLQAVASADGVRLTWTPLAGVLGAAYNVYRGPADGVLSEHPQNVKSVADREYLDTTTESGKRYRYVVRAVLADGTPYREGASSAPVEVDASDVFAPAAPGGLVVVQEGRAVRLLWNPSIERDLDGYRVYRRVGEGAWMRIGPDPLRKPTLLDANVEPSDVVSYRVTAIDRAIPPNEGPPSSEATIRAAAEPAAPAAP